MRSVLLLTAESNQHCTLVSEASTMTLHLKKRARPWIKKVRFVPITNHQPFLAASNGSSLR